jgi:hypothetical protein
LIIDLDNLWRDVRGVQISSKYEKLLFLAISKSGPIDRMISYLKTQLGDLFTVRVSVDSKLVLFLAVLFLVG